MSTKTSHSNPGAPLSDQCAVTREITVAKGLFAPGHLGEPTRIVPFDMVDEALAGTGATQRRSRKLPVRVVVYLLLAAALFEECGYLAVRRKLTAALEAIPIPKVTGAALWHARTRLGARSMRTLFDLLRGPSSTIRTADARRALPWTQRKRAPRGTRFEDDLPDISQSGLTGLHSHVR
ncbi:transposase domain-containing protein [Nocardiopsis synnemataformans]|uniref:transposase domain-containing protein n=1 Tax=Nocardiopsis synnemataformans TaxID=61305 RepID=UPI003EC0A7A9